MCSSISLWSTQRKKPVYTQALAHGLDVSQVDAKDIATVRKPRWITALGTLRYSDLFASGTSRHSRTFLVINESSIVLGSWDGEVRLWKLDAKLKSFSLISTLPALGVVNSLQFVNPPNEFFSSASWAMSPVNSKSEAESQRLAQPNGKQKPAQLGAAAVLLVAGVGQEMRAGRWIHQKGEGYMNGAVVFALHPRT